MAGTLSSAALPPLLSSVAVGEAEAEGSAEGALSLLLLLVLLASALVSTALAASGGTGGVLSSLGASMVDYTSTPAGRSAERGGP